MSWWEDAVVYQVYPRSFLDADGDGVGDLLGIERGLDHIAQLGANALWLSPVYPSPGADMGYDVADFCDIDPLFGDLEQFDRLLAAAHARGLKLLMDLVPCHTSVEHPWFLERPDVYVWADGRDGLPPNNWLATFGGAAWTQAANGRWYLHSFYPEQPDLNWRNPDVRQEMQEVVRFWVARGVDGFRLDALDRLLKDPLMRDDPPATEPFGLPLEGEFGRLDHVYSTNSPDIGLALSALREAAGNALLVGEVFLPAARVAPYLDHLDAAFAFELFHSPWDSEALGYAIAACAAAVGRGGGPGSAWAISNHDFPRVPTRVGAENVRAAAVLLLTLPGPAFIYQGEEIGQRDGPPGQRHYDRAGRDACRHPVQWQPDARTGGFTEGEPWLAPVDAPECNIADQTAQAGSMLELYRELIALRPLLTGAVSMLDADTGVVAYRRGEHVVAVNTTDRDLRAPAEGDLVLCTHAGHPAGDRLAAHSATVRADRLARSD